MATYRLGSSPIIATPGIIAWAINGYAFEADRPNILKVITEGFPSVPADAIEQLLSEKVPFTVEGETVVFSVED